MQNTNKTSARLQLKFLCRYRHTHSTDGQAAWWQELKIVLVAFKSSFWANQVHTDKYTCRTTHP